MRRAIIVSLLCGCAGTAPNDTAARIADAARAGGALDKLVELCDDVGPRLSGSAGLDRAIEWAQRAMKADGHENVRAEKVMVPKWVRGRESLEMLEPRAHEMRMLGLGGSVATPPEGITAEVVVARTREELGDATGKIVVWNHAMPSYDPVKGARYGETVAYRVNGATWAAEKGAVAALVRSITARSMVLPHTGGMRYGAGPKIPTAAITIEDADMLARFAARGKKVVLRLKMEARDEGEAPSANVVGELVGSAKPDEIVVISGHLDSWDATPGAHDDGAGCVIAMEALTVLRKLGLRPQRTIRVVLWTNEENGMAGVRTYLRDHAMELHKHVAAIESDNGGYRPLGFHLDVTDEFRLKLATAQLKVAIAPLGLDVKPGGSAPDVGHFKPWGVPCMGLWVDGSIYFDYHHTAADTIDKVKPDELNAGVAATALAAWALADSPMRFGRPALVAGQAEKVATGFKFTEGPAADRDGNVYFTDIPNERIVTFDAKTGKTEVVREKSGAANGLAFDRDRRLWACEGGARRLSRDGETAADAFDGRKLNSPNDLELDAKGGCYFTDPRYGKRDDLEQPVEGVYYLSPDGKLARVIDSLRRPNGVTLSPDGKTLYVADEPERKIVAFDVKADGAVEKPRDFAKFPWERGGGADGMTVDEFGNLYAAARGGIWIFDRGGGSLGLIAVPENPTNCAFAGSTLYVTAQTSLYRVAMNVKGAR
jgi:carboxypeptidase Q